MTQSWKIGLAVAFVMVIVVMSYRQNVHAYPSGGGDYEVASVNLGPKAGLTVASALLVDYVLTVAVSVSSGVQNAATALPFLRGHEAITAVVIVALLTAAAVSFCGIILFVGLVVPHFMRLIVGPRHLVLIPASALAGAGLLTAADLAARTLVPYGELPIGMVTSLVGGPVFLLLLRREMKRGGWL